MGESGMAGTPAAVLALFVLTQVSGSILPSRDPGQNWKYEGGAKEVESLEHVLDPEEKRGYDAMSGLTFGKKKRNFDEIDRYGFGAFAKRNFDEIDRAGFRGFHKRNFDEIDRSGFNGLMKLTAQDSGGLASGILTKLIAQDSAILQNVPKRTLMKLTERVLGGFHE